jgi:ABC-type multidrug transport system fused ATPase/permease subunit
MPKFNYDLELVDKIDKKMYFESAVFWIILNITGAYLFVFCSKAVMCLIDSKLLDWDTYLRTVCVVIGILVCYIGLFCLAGLILYPIQANFIYSDDETEAIKVIKRPLTSWFILPLCLIVTGRFWQLVQTPFAANITEYCVLIGASVLFSLINHWKLKIYVE